MGKKITFLVLNNNETIHKHFKISKFFIISFLVILMTAFTGAGYILYDYIKIQKHLYEKTALDRKVAEQKQEISKQRKQIQTFASKIYFLESEIEELHNFEKKIRTIAKLENTKISETEQDEAFGIGGSVSEGLDNEMVLEEVHTDLVLRMHQQVQHIELAALNQKESFESLFKSLENQITAMASTPSIRPTKGLITSTFGYRKSPFTGLRDFHSGLDIGAKIGSPVKATADGKVTFADRQGYLGKLVVIDHGHGLITRYAHLSKILINCGDIVKKGEIVGKVGNTGKSTGSHLHYEVHLDGVPVNPLKYILN